MGEEETKYRIKQLPPLLTSCNQCNFYTKNGGRCIGTVLSKEDALKCKALIPRIAVVRE
jgi:hypothetical protein